MPIYISFYTPNYKNHADRLIDSLNKFNLNYDVQPIQSQGNWFKNCNFKPIFIKQMLNKYNCPVVWLDADAIVQQYPITLQNLNFYDIAFYTLIAKNIKIVCSGTLWFNTTPSSYLILNSWINSLNDTILDQQTLQTTLSTIPFINTFHLDHKYCLIFDHKEQQQFKPAIIEHFQASRKLKR